MDNFQLYRTNVSLGGQLKWDLILDSIDSKLMVKDFHISPISGSVPFNKYNHESLLNYSHQDNVREFYNKISGSFYESYANPQLESDWPILSDKPIDTHNSDFEMGCRRVLYSTHNKQLEFLCPVWIEHLDGELIFELSAYTTSGSRILQKRLTLSKFNQKYHDRFVDYFNNYIKYIGVDKGNDNIMSIQLDKKLAYVSGLNVSTGDMNTINISHITEDLISRERPLLEFDNIIINQLKDYKLVTPQLFNFNLCFNPEDLLPAVFLNELMGKSISFEVKVYIGENRLKIKDFYSNYEYIPRKFVGSIFDTLPNNMVAPNVLDYLQDYKCVDIIDKNKITQNVIHWSLVGNNDYIFNVYEGFKGFSLDGMEIVNHAHLYDNSPDINHADYKQYLNNTGWCNNIIIENTADHKKINEVDFVRNMYAYAEFASDFSNDVEWINKIRYNTLEESFELKVMLVENKTDGELNFNKYINSELLVDCVLGDLHIYYYDDKKLLMIICDENSKNQTTFINMYNLLKEVEDNDLISNKLIQLRSKMAVADHSNNPPLIKLMNTLSICRADGPSTSTKEITYYKENNNGEYVLRYFGKIKPTFVSEGGDINFNYLYYKQTLKSYKHSKYETYNETKFLPKYPSVHYFPIDKIKQEYSKLPSLCLYGDNEYHWFNNNKNIILNPFIETKLESKIVNGKYVPLKDLVKDYIRDYYSIPNEDLTSYIFNLYKYESSFDYKSVDNIVDYIYNVKITLK